MAVYLCDTIALGMSLIMNFHLHNAWQMKGSKCLVIDDHNCLKLVSNSLGAVVRHFSDGRCPALLKCTDGGVETQHQLLCIGNRHVGDEWQSLHALVCSIQKKKNYSS